MLQIYCITSRRATSQKGITSALVTRQELRDCEWWVTEKLSPLIGGEPLGEGVKNNIFAYYYEGMH